MKRGTSSSGPATQMARFSAVAATARKRLLPVMGNLELTRQMP